MAEKAYITAKVFKWARESAKMTEEIAASKVAVSIDKFKDWENGEDFPTIRQAQTLAKAYRRPFALFFLPDVPTDFQPLQDFRKTGSKELSTSSIFIIREIQQKQAWISEVNEDNNENRVPFIGRFTIKDNPVLVAKDILATLNINPLNYKSNNPIIEWIDKAEYAEFMENFMKEFCFIIEFVVKCTMYCQNRCNVSFNTRRRLRN